ncbi:MAG: hypothetical protein COW01_10545 [Bdellovibrionales bacterium CG12_big_fil_rev_8_21_14_0_65_38_15]|nr:MAG: hypothetical protein COW79_07390 [Bdellovibrionales bacterium CG22_combo_CG10-13_8_21_14_all_38_13]PIQ54575.1 MAG: hypothetical protein COW01_10545 [Bdellovibrionales bacterium CG12_big_fil_rev_8_21_14_0_65_38_15]PIR29956.1 MAG: hypothetical protein COV38_08390 [Bdellovibrionales bacterium CG11_big_fil_rev_8_21_14_0_20_38_13]
MNIDSDKAKAFYQLALDGSFSKASKSLCISQPALSQKIARLEDELEMTLVIRSSKELVLTSSGLELVRYYKTKIELDKSFYRSISLTSGSLGELSVAGYSSIIRSALIPVMAKAQSESRVRFNLISKEVHELSDLLLSGKVDFVITTEMINRENIVNILIAEEELVHIMPRSRDVTLPFLDHDEKDSTTFHYFKKIKKEMKIERSFMDDIYGIIDGVKKGLGQAIVSNHLVRDCDEISKINHRDKVKTKVYLSYFEKVYYPKHHITFLEIIKKDFKKYL